MPNTTYTVEHAKSGRAACKKCKDKIGKGEIRIGAASESSNGYDMQAWYHPKCFNLPKKITIEEFMDDMLEDTTEDKDILPEKRDQIMADVEYKPPKTKNASSGDEYLDSLKAAYEQLQEADGSNDKKKKKRKKKGDDDDAAAEAEEPDKKKAKIDPKDVDPEALEQYGKYSKMKLDEIKDVLRWNRQVLKGTKPVVLHKAIDGALNGRLPPCSLCGGKLQFQIEGANAFKKVICNGNFDEDIQARIPCSVSYPVEEAPRAKPWYDEKPTEEEEEEMDRLAAAAKGEEEKVDPANVDDDSDLGKLIAKAKKLDLDFSSSDKIKASTKAMITMLQEDGKLDLPDEKKLRMEVGKLLVASKDETVNEICAALQKKFGWKAKKEEKTAKKEAAVAGGCTCEANGPLVSAFNELSDLYFGEGNTNAGVANKKVTAALKNLDFEVTEKNALSLGKAGPNKVDGVGASSAKKIKEFLTTGTMEKLEEKRANAAM